MVWFGLNFNAHTKKLTSVDASIDRSDEEIEQAGIEELLERATPEEIAEFLEETEVPVRKRRRRTTEQEVDWTELARRKRALKRHRPTIE